MSLSFPIFAAILSRPGKIQTDEGSGLYGPVPSVQECLAYPVPKEYQSSDWYPLIRRFDADGTWSNLFFWSRPSNKWESFQMSTGTMEAVSVQPAVDPWSMEVKEAKDYADFEICPAGNHPGVICAIIDVGHQDENDKDGKPILVRKLVLAWQLTKADSKGKRFVMAERYTWSMASNSNFFKLAVAISGAKKEGEKFDPRSLIGKAVLVNVIHKTGSDRQGKERTYANIEGITPYPEGLPVPQLDGSPVIWSVMEGKPAPDLSFIPPIYGQKVGQMIADSAEAKAGRVPGAAAVATPGSDKPPF